MMRAVVCLALLAACAATDVTPIQKVIEMMDGMLAKGKSEKHDEEVEFAKYHEWCDQVRDEKTTSIAEATAQIEELAAAIDKAESDAEVLAAEVADLEKEVASSQQRTTLRLRSAKKKRLTTTQHTRICQNRSMPSHVRSRHSRGRRLMCHSLCCRFPVSLASLPKIRH
jgi:uncharacterized protein YdaT